MFASCATEARKTTSSQIFCKWTQYGGSVGHKGKGKAEGGNGENGVNLEEIVRPSEEELRRWVWVVQRRRISARWASRRRGMAGAEIVTPGVLGVTGTTGTFSGTRKRKRKAGFCRSP